MEFIDKAKELSQSEVVLIDNNKLNNKLVERLTLITKDIPDKLIVEDFVKLKSAIRNKKIKLKENVQHVFEVKLFRGISQELEINKDWINVNDGVDTLMEKINKEISIKNSCEEYIDKQFIDIINKINIKINKYIETSEDISIEDSLKSLTKFIRDNDLEYENNTEKRNNHFIKNGKMAIVAPDSIQKDINGIEKNLKGLKINRKIKNRFLKVKNRYESVIKLINENYKDRENRYDTIKMLNDSAKYQFKEVMNEVTKEIKKQKNLISANNTTLVEERLFLNKDILDKKRNSRK